MDSENPRRDEHIPRTGRRQSTLPSAAASTNRHTGHLTETTFAYQSALFAASATASSDAFHTRTVMYPSEAEPPDDQPVIVPVLSAQPVTQPFLRSDERDDDAPDYRWPDDEESHLEEDESDFEYEVDPELNIPDSISGQVFTRDDAFALHERNHDRWKQFRKTALALLSLASMLVVAAFGAAVAASYLHRATDHLTIPAPIPTVSSYSNGVVVQPGSESIAPTPEAPKYQIGAWMSNNAPGGGAVKVFVRLTEDVAPVPQVPVTLSVQMPDGSVVKLGPTNTDGYGLATFTVNFGGIRGAPIFVTASATVGAENLQADTVFVPA